MPKSMFNHRRRIKGLQPSTYKAIYPGMLVQFKYVGENITDKLPLILVLWNDYGGSKIHGINFNYMAEGKIKNIFQAVMKGGKGKRDDISLEEQDQDASDDYDDTLPNRNLLTEPYTRLMLPTYKEVKNGNPISKSEAVTNMKRLYDKVLKKYVRRMDMYRSYSYNKMKSIKVVRYDIEGLLK